MPLRESREIAFGPASLCRVLGWTPGAALDAVGLPRGAVPCEARLLPAEGRVALAYPGRGEVVVAADRLGALLLAYCVRARIPVMRRSTKTVRVTPEAVVLATAHEHAAPPDPAATGTTAPTERRRPATPEPPSPSLPRKPMPW